LNLSLSVVTFSRLGELRNEITENMKKYDLPGATRPISNFIEDLSTWYLRQTRDRLNEKDESAIKTIKNVLEELSKLIAPFIPFSAEFVWQKITGNNFKKDSKSVHLENWPEGKDVDRKVLEEMKKVREIISTGLKERDKEHIGLKWPLAKADIYVVDSKKIKNYEEIIKEQLNVKKINFHEADRKLEYYNIRIDLDFELTAELEAEGYAREVSRKVQAFRKKLGLKKENEIELILIVDKDFKEILEKEKELIKKRTNSRELNLENVTTDKERFKNNMDFKIKDKRGEIVIIL
ncbi:MAG: class I tRNA ligase family protein, partial [Nanoarchaeota archaeon]